MNSSNVNAQRRLAVIVGALSGLGSGIAAFAVISWLAGQSDSGVPAAWPRWVILPAALALVVSWWVTGWRARGRVIFWVAALALLLASGLALLTWPEPAGEVAVASNALLYGRMAPMMLLVAAVLVGFAAVLSRRLDAEAHHRSQWFGNIPRILLAVAATSFIVLGGVVVPRLIDARVGEHNTSTSSAHTAVNELATELTGEVAWSEPAPSHQRPLGTAGGVALPMPEAGGIRMLDPATGEARWSWQRSDLNSIRIKGSHPVASTDGTLIAAAFTALDQYPKPPSVVVFNADTGSEEAVLTDEVGHPVAVERDQIVALSDDGTLTSYSFDGTPHWSLQGPEELTISSLVSHPDSDGQTLLLTRGSQNLAIDLASGEMLWTERKSGWSPQTMVPGTDMAVSQRFDTDEDRDAPSGVVRAVDVRDRQPRWERDVTGPASFTGDADTDGGFPNLDVDGDHLTFVASGDYGRETTLTSLDPETGEQLWHEELTRDSSDLPIQLPNERSLLAMPDGSTAFLAPTDDSYEACEIVRIDDSTITRRSAWPGIEEGCEYAEWWKLGNTVLLAPLNPDELIALD